MKIGFIGTGIIASSVVTGFCESEIQDLSIMVSPRNRERARILQETYPHLVSIAADNQEVVDQSDWIFLSLLPQVSEDVLKTLHIPPEKNFINLVSTLSLERIEAITGPRKILTDVVPLTFAANRFGPIIAYPPISEVSTLLSHIGDVVEVETTKQISILRSISGLMSPYYMLLTTLTHWCEKNGLDEATARHYVTAFTAALSKKASGWEGDLENLTNEMTPGGLNWKSLTHIQKEHGFETWTDILDEILTIAEK